jgi:hypothetical protein
MVDEARRQIDEGHRGEALRTAARLSRLYPKGFREVLGAFGRRGQR